MSISWKMPISIGGCVSDYVCRLFYSAATLTLEFNNNRYTLFGGRYGRIDYSGGFSNWLEIIKKKEKNKKKERKKRRSEDSDVVERIVWMLLE